MTTPRKVVLSDGKAWVISAAAVSPGAKDPLELIEKSLHGALSIVDVSSPADASVTGGISFLPPLDPVDVRVRGPLAFVAARGMNLPYLDVVGEEGAYLIVVDASEPTGPTILATVPGVGNAMGLAVAGDLALLAGGDGGLGIFSIADPSRPLLLGAIDQFRVGGVLQSASVEAIQLSGSHHAVATLAFVGGAKVQVVLDLSLPGFPVVGELGAQGGADAVAVFNRRGVGVSERAGTKTLSLVPPTRPHLIAPVSSLVTGVGFTDAAVGPQLSALGGKGYLQLVTTSDPARPVSVDAVDLFPAIGLSDVAVSGDLAAATISEVAPKSGALHALALVQMPFPMVVASRPEDGDVAVPLNGAIEVDLNRAPSDVSATTVKLVRLDGSAAGSIEPASVTLEGLRIRLVPSAPLATSATYQLRVEGLHDAATGSPMPGAFLSEFTTAASATAVPISLSSIGPRQGPSSGGTAVALTGTGFVPGMEVRFSGAIAEISELSADGTHLVVTAPAGSAGAATLSLRSPGGPQLDRLGAFLYVDPLQLTGITPGRGPTAGGTRVTISGKGFAPQGGVKVTFAGVPALQVRVQGVDRIEAITPDGLRGPADLRVENPDGTSATIAKAFVFDQPTGASVSLGAARDVLVIHTLAFVLEQGSLRVVDLSGLYRFGEFAGTPIPPDRTGSFIDENKDFLEDRFIGQVSLSGEATSLSYPGSGDLLYVGTLGRDKKGEIVRGGVSVVDVSDPAHPRVVSSAAAGTGGVFGLDARDERLIAAAGSAGLRAFDISHAPFPIRSADVAPPAQAIAVRQGLAAVGLGQRSSDFKVSGGQLQLWSIEGAYAPIGSLPLNVQRVRLREDLAVVAAGDEGLVLVDLSDPAHPVRLSELDVGGFAWDVRLSGDLAYVAAGNAGVAVVDLTSALAPKVLYHVSGAHAGDARVVGLGDGQLVTLRDGGFRGWSLDYGLPAELSVTGASVEAGETVPLDLSAVTLFFSSAFDSTTAGEAFSFTANGVPVPISPLEAGDAENPRSTIVARPSEGLPADAELRLSVTTALTTRAAQHLVAPFSVGFRSAGAPGARPVFSQLVPRVGPASGGQVAELLGDGFEPGATVRVGGASATVLATSSTRLTIQVPPGAWGLADVVVENPSGLSVRRSGGYLYVLPLYAQTATPRFLNPRGGSTVRVTGEGFLPAWADPLGSTRVLVRGLPATNVNVLSLNELTASAPPGSFGPAEVTLVSPDGIVHSEAPSPVGYGLRVLRRGEGGRRRSARARRGPGSAALPLLGRGLGRGREPVRPAVPRRAHGRRSDPRVVPAEHLRREPRRPAARGGRPDRRPARREGQSVHGQPRRPRRHHQRRGGRADARLARRRGFGFGDLRRERPQWHLNPRPQRSEWVAPARACGAR